MLREQMLGFCKVRAALRPVHRGRQREGQGTESPDYPLCSEGSQAMRGPMGCKAESEAVNWRLPSKNAGVPMLKDRKWWCSDNEIFEIQILEVVYYWLWTWPRIAVLKHFGFRLPLYS